MKKLKAKTRKMLKPYWKELQILQDQHCIAVYNLERKMQRGVGIDDLEFVYCDGFCGIGNLSRTIELIHEEELEKE